MLNIIIGIVVILAAIVAGIVCIRKTPENLRGFYGKMFFAIAAIAVIGGATLIITGAING